MTKCNDKNEQRRHNTGLAKVAVQSSADTFVVNQSLVLRINIFGANRHLRQARKRYGQVKETTQWTDKKTANINLDRQPLTRV
jgi:hypothetical protein